ncbi:putative ATP-dependent RNA helicase [Tersicoccus solisilvae]|uniref:ATP-dependent RNA helicase n=1 Tax=Tersicoccus solisilvae TaxID=1882339 RepID=A0ABQ1NM21_9MICC|nr:DEAD/DEAH box helicase [Tersicoccus solisilvae]GGC80492.1 putative ATP-dependent RNA helicase [Tersicoccus solisilvae]
MTSFADLGVPSVLADALTASGIAAPFPIQEATLPDSLAGRDVLGRGRTGSGKTLAFSLPLVARLAGVSRRASRPTGLVLAPTRELATQINATLEPLAGALGLRTTVIFGGVSQKRQETALRAGADIVVACPGRLEDLLRQKVLTLADVRITVLDEADHMADLGFLPVVRRLLDATAKDAQRLLFSATLDNGVDVLVKRYLHDPKVHSVDESAAAVTTMEHRVFLTDTDAKKDLVTMLASGTGRRVMFMRTKHHAKKMAKQLTSAGIPAVDLHGNLSQNARDRNLAQFSSGEVRVLVATDVAARGVHVDDVELVVHIDPPTEHKAYLHRSGRTARAGSDGTVVTVVLPEQRQDVRKLLRAAGVDAPLETVTPDSAAVAEVVGTIAPRVAPAPVSASGNRPGASRKPATAPSARSGGDGGGRSRGGRGRGRGGQGESASAPRSTASSRGGARRGGSGARAGAPANSRPAATVAYSTSTGSPAGRRRGSRRADAPNTARRQG